MTYFLFITDMFFGSNFLQNFDVCSCMIAKNIILIVKHMYACFKTINHLQHVQNISDPAILKHCVIS